MARTRRLAGLLLTAAAATALTTVLVPAGGAGASTPAASTRTGPPLRVAPARLRSSLRCHGDEAAATRRPVLLVPGTTLTPKVNYSWNYEKVFDAGHRPWCTVRLPHHAMSDIQVSGEFVVHAIRVMYRRAGGHRISIVGFSQGGMVPRWALKWWPDTRHMVTDMIGIDPSNHGTLDAYPVCAPGCAPSIWQQRSGSRFLKALNRGGETFAGISYTQMYTATDEVVVPNLGPRPSSALHTGHGRIANISVQSICPGHVADHLTMGTFDPVAYALVHDALTHRGPARSARIGSSVCTRTTMPGVSTASAALHLARVGAVAAKELTLSPHVTHEPRLEPYARRH